MDYFIGQILEKAKECSGGRKTIVIFTSDHGEMLGNHGKFDKHAYCYEDVIRTPLLVCPDLKLSLIHILEEVEKYLVEAQDLETTIKNIKERADEAIKKASN